jgi:hypothetical protein
MEATERMHPVPPPFNLPITLGAFAHKASCTIGLGTAIARWFESTPVAGLLDKLPPSPWSKEVASLAASDRDRDSYDYATNKKLKGKIARAWASDQYRDQSVHIRRVGIFACCQPHVAGELLLKLRRREEEAAAQSQLGDVARLVENQHALKQEVRQR